MTQPLFFESTLSLEKVAYDIRLDDDPDEWPVAVLRESYKQLPFLKSYETEVEFERLDPARGYAVGKMMVWPAKMDKNAAASNKQLVTVPVIVRDREMSPLDVYTHNDLMQPMDQDKVAQLLFKPHSIERAAPRDQFTGTNLYGQLTPPNTDHQYNAGSLNKHGSAGLWAEVRFTLSEDQVNAFAEKLASDHALRQSFAQTPQLREVVKDLTQVTEKTASYKRAERMDHLKPTVVQIKEHGKDYMLKTANHRCWAPRAQVVSRFEAQEMLSKEAFDRLLTDGQVTLTTDVVGKVETVKTAQDANRVGVYQVRSAGQMVEGVVVPRMMDFDGKPLGLQVFAGPGTHSVQEKVAGVFIEDLKISSDRPRGLGVFVYQEGGLAVATEPVSIEGTVKVAHEHGNSATLVGTRMQDGTPIKVTVVNGLKKIAMIGNEVAIPPNFRFLSLEGKQTKVASTPEDVHLFEHKKVAGANSVEVVSDGSFYSLRGQNSEPFNGEIMTQDEALFALAGLGLSGSQATDLLKTASVRSSATAPNTRQVLTEESRGFEAMQKAASVIRRVPDLAVDLTTEVAILTAPKGQELWKQASVIVSRETTDAILSLGFVTPENASLYVNYLPELEKVSSKLAELLVASRLGMDDIREQAAKNAMTQVNAVVRGLETLRERIN